MYCVKDPHRRNLLFQDYKKPWAMGAITVASVGAFTTILCTVAIIVYWNTTIMR